MGSIVQLEVCELAPILDVRIRQHLEEGVHIVRDAQVDPYKGSWSITPTYPSSRTFDCLNADYIVVISRYMGKAISPFWYYLRVGDHHVTMGAREVIHNIAQPIVF